jgi:hypothetical protein
MTQLESIHYLISMEKIALARTKAMVPENEMWNLFKEEEIKHHLKELQDLKFCLKCVLDNLSK